MSELEMPTVITAIASSETESFVAGTLFTQGWSVIFRAIDWDSLERFINGNPEIVRGALLLFASDLPGISKSRVDLIAPKFRQTIGFSTANQQDNEFMDLYEVPESTTDLVSLVRGFVRAPLLRGANSPHRAVRKARVIAVGSAGSYTGCTMVSMNLAMELSILEKSTLLIEGNYRAPSIAAYLAMRNINGDSEFKTIAPNLALTEIDQELAGKIDELLDRAARDFDFIVIDLGSISGLSNRLTDRRWTSTMTTWCCDQADELMIVSRADQLGAHRLNQVIELLHNTSVRANLSFVMNMKSPGKRGENEQARFLTSTTALKPIRVRSISKDSRAIVAAEEEHATLVEINMRSNARKSIADLARELES
jgi:Mrp family chromosome partitioning ATPase